MTRNIIILSLVERGWQATRACSLDLAEHRLYVLHVVKGYVGRSVRMLVASHSFIRLVSVPRWLFWPCVWLSVTAGGVSGHLGAVIVDNERSFKRMKRWEAWFRLSVVRVQQGKECYQIWKDREALSGAVWFQRIGLESP